MNNKGFTLVEILATIAILGILSGIVIGGVQKYIEKSRQQAYDTLASSSVDATKEYVMDHPGVEQVYFDDLLEGNYIDNISNPKDNSSNCSGRVKVNTKKGSNGVLDDYTYNVFMCCGSDNYAYEFPKKKHYKTNNCKAHAYDISEIKEIKVLHVYPNNETKLQLTNWMSDKKSGDERIKVIPVSIENFNNDPNSYLGDVGNWKIDVAVFGFWDCNASKDLSAKSSSVLETYMNSGGSVIFGHDTMTRSLNHPNFNRLAPYMNMSLDGGGYNRSTQVTIVRAGIFTEYPYRIGTQGTVLTIPSSHVTGQVAHGDVWLTFSGVSQSSYAATVYLSTYKNNAFIQTGDHGGQASPDEQKIIANIIFYMKAKQDGLVSNNE